MNDDYEVKIESENHVNTNAFLFFGVGISFQGDCVKKTLHSRSVRYGLSGLLVVLMFLLAWQVSAQSGGGDGWEDPLNLSLSGTAVEPTLAVAPSGKFYLFWQDRLAGYQYSSGDGQNWRPPVKLLVPFTNPPYSPVVGVEDFGGFYKPKLAIDQDNVLHGFWSDDEQKLRYSRAALLEDDVLSDWTATESLSEIVSGFSVLAGSDNALHLAYIRPSTDTEIPPGVYYRRSVDGGVTWTEPQLVYESDYLRPLDAEKTNIKTAVADNGKIFIVWDDPLIEKVFVSRSADQGANWSDPLIVDQRLPNDALESPGPQNIDIVTQGSDVYLAWQGGHEPRLCSVYSQASPDGGQTWGDVQKVLDTGSPECPSLTRLFLGENDLLFLLTKVVIPQVERTQLFIQAWDGEQWSEGERQDTLFDFRDPASYRTVSFSCLQDYVTQENVLFLASCGVNRAVEDIWVMQRPLGDAAVWSERFAPPSAWSSPDFLTTREAAVQSPAVFIDAEGNIHAFWNEPVGELGNPALFHMVKDESGWSRPLTVLKSPDGGMRQQSIALDRLHNRFLVTWIDDQNSRPYFSQVDVAAVALATDWSDPLFLPAVDLLNEWPQVLLDDAGNILVVYTVPVNENRGVYLTRSEDGGNTWQDPALWFDGAAADWPVVGQPALTISDDGVFNLLVKRPLSPMDSQADLFYLRSEDAGQTWTEPVQVNDQLSGWAQLEAPNSGALHVVYQEQANNRVTTWHTNSTDNGVSWVPPVPVTDFEADNVPVSLMSDAAGNLHIVFFTDATLQYRWWNGTNWLIGENKELDGKMAAYIALDAQMGKSGFDVVYVKEFQADAPLATDDEEEVEGVLPPLSYELYRVTYSLAESELQPAAEAAAQVTPEVEPTAVPTSAPTAVPAQPTEEAEETAVVEVTAVPALQNATDFPTQPAPRNNGISPWVVSIGAALLLILIVFVIGIVRMRRK
ncbi:MAG TPA: hypothetical protein ENJ93_06250 [Chloroflexi bacterium]|nr:hypothetical protein [Chloroflexota bacterium]